MMQRSAARAGQWESRKIEGHHRDRLALVYVRQSTVQQVHRHQESTRLQYGLVERAVQLGWPAERVEVIDDDLGRSGSSAEGRPGFQRLVAAVSLDRVGLVLGIEMSRLARSCRDWHQLLEVCGVFRTLIADLDGVYDPGLYNDRLLLGLKGTMSEAELHIIKQRMHQGRLAKARRGELAIALPMGYVRRPSGEVIKDPDEQAVAVIERVFELFEQHRTIHGVLRQLVDEAVQMPVRLREGPDKGQLEWRRPNRVSLSNLLHNPTYAGAYAYGRRPIDPRRKKPGRPATGRLVATPEQWEVLLEDQHPAYISWEQYERNLRQLAANTASAKGTIRRGSSLLSGLIICGRCGLKMATQYNNNGSGLRYTCNRMTVDYAEAHCQSLQGGVLDAAISELALQTLEPSSLEVSLHVAEDVEAQRQKLHEQWNHRLERARYKSERARRQYDAAEPENRLVVRSLERLWEEALAEQESLEQHYARFQTEQPMYLTAADREAIRALAADIPALWSASTTTDADRQAIVRHLIDRVLVTVEGETERVTVHVHWNGGHKTATTVVRPVARLDQLSYYTELLERVRGLHGESAAPNEIARVLNDEGWRPPKRRATFNGSMVRELLHRQGIVRPSDRRERGQRGVDRPADQWLLRELALELKMPEVTLYSWLRKGCLDAHRDETDPRKRWYVQADEGELARLRSLRRARRTWKSHRRIDGSDQSTSLTEA